MPRLNTDSDVRVAVTGLGAVSGHGWGIGPLWESLRAGRTAIRRIGRFDPSRHRTQVAAETPPAPAGLDRSAGDWRHLSLADRFAVAAAREALAAAKLPARLDDPRCGLFFGSSTGGFWESEEFFAALVGAHPVPVRVGLLRGQQCNAPGDAVAREVGIGGPVETVSAACASGTLALGAALEALRAGEIDRALVGGADSLCQLTHGGFNSLRSVDSRPCRPFQAGREGLSIGEGAAVLVLERHDAARDRGVPVIAELLGCGSSCDAQHMTAPDPAGGGPSRAMLAALADAGVGPGDIRFVNAHGTGTPLNDAAEFQAMTLVFGARAGEVPVTATKGSVGHLLGSSGAIEAVATVLCLAHRVVHPTPGEGPVDPEAAVRLVLGEALPIEPGPALTTNLAFGGSNAAAVFGPGEAA